MKLQAIYLSQIKIENVIYRKIYINVLRKHICILNYLMSNMSQPYESVCNVTGIVNIIFENLQFFENDDSYCAHYIEMKQDKILIEINEKILDRQILDKPGVEIVVDVYNFGALMKDKFPMIQFNTKIFDELISKLLH